jgi:hypothetical protein
MEKTIPEDLAVALLGPMMPGEPTDVTLVAGHYSADLPANLAPDGFVSLGAVCGEQMSLNVAVTQLSADEALCAMDGRLKSAGWIVLTNTQSVSGGFTSGSESLSGGPYCGADGTCVVITTRRRGSGGSYGRWTVTKPDSPYNTCKRTPVQMSLQPTADIPMPTLKTPSGVSAQRSHGSSASGDSRVAYATAVTTLSVGNLLRAYAEQVQKAGWKAHPETIGDFGALQSFELTDPGSRSWRGVLAVVDNGADRAVLFRVNLTKAP